MSQDQPVDILVVEDTENECESIVAVLEESIPDVCVVAVVCAGEPVVATSATLTLR